MAILILSSSEDITTQTVVPHLSSASESVYIFDYAAYPLESALSYRVSNQEEYLWLATETFELDFRDVTSIWYRRPGHPQYRQDRATEVNEYIEGESKFFLDSIYHLTPQCFWVGFSPNPTRKPLQLKLAKEIGFTIPDTLVGNSRFQAELFCEAHDRIALKALHRSYLTNPKKDLLSIVRDFFKRGTQEISQEQYDTTAIYTKILDRTELLQIGESIQSCPVIIQEAIQKTVELRITVVGQQVFACAIHSQEFQESEEDFRRLDDYHLKLRHEVYTLPSEISEKCIELMRRMNLQFGCIDMIVTPDNEYVFLEINKNGQWIWIEQQTQLPIGKAIADLLITRKGV